MKKIAIVGGGIIGLTLANYLDQTKYSVTLFDEPTGQATGASAGIISPWLSKRRNKQWYELAKDGAALFPKLVADLGLDETIYHQTGTLLLRPAEKLPELVELAESRKAAAPEIGELALLSADQTAEKLPLLKPAPALFISGGGKLDGKNYLRHLKNRSQTTITFIPERVQLVADGAQTKIKTATKTYDFDQIILTPGPHLKELLAPIGYQADIRPQKGQLLVFETDFTDSKNWPVAMLDGEADLIPFEAGKILIGATHENEGGWDLAETKAAFTQLTENSRAFLAQPERLLQANVHYRVGTRAYTSDFAPFFGRLNEQLIVASGLGSSGLTTGPLIGYLIAKALNEQTPIETTRYQKPLENYIKKSV